MSTKEHELTEQSPKPERKFDLTLEQAIPEMEDILENMRGETDRVQLQDIDSDTAFELGYETALFDLKHLTSPDPREIGIIVYTKEEEKAE